MVKTQKYLSNVEESIELEKKTYSIKKKLDKKNIQEGEKLLIFKFPLTELKGQIEMYVERERERERANIPRKEPPTTRIISFLRVS